MRNTIITTVTSSHATKRLGSTSKGYQHQSPVQSKSVICWPDWIWPAHGEHWRECRRCRHLRRQHGTPLQIAFFNYIANKSCDGRHWHVWFTFDFGSFLLFSSKTFDDWFCFLFQSSKSGSGELIKIPKNIFEGKVRGISNESHRKCPIDRVSKGCQVVHKPGSGTSGNQKPIRTLLMEHS